MRFVPPSIALALATALLALTPCGGSFSVDRWRAATTEAAFLSTSRVIRGEAAVQSVEPLSDDAGIALFTARASVARRDFDPGQEPDAIRALVARLDGLPLVLLKSIEVDATETAEQLAEGGVVDQAFPGIVARSHLDWRILGPNQNPQLRALLGLGEGASAKS